MGSETSPEDLHGKPEEPASLGEQEMDLLRFVSARAPVTSAELVESYGEERKLARTTVLTVLERLRRKGYVVRRRREGVFHYSPRMSQSEVLRGLVQRFVETTLSGSVAPVVQFLANTPRMTPSELKELEQIVETLRARKAEAEEKE